MARREVDEWFWQVGSELHRLAEEIGTTRTRIAHARAWEPRIDVFDDGEKIVIRAEIAGIRGEDIQLLYLPNNNRLLIRGHRPEQSTVCSGSPTYYQLEIFYGEFEREVQLPDVTVEPEGIRAQYRNGILHILIPRREPDHRAHRPT